MEKAKDIDVSKIDTQSVEFQNALRLISFTSQSVFLTGKAGTGKSTFLKYLTATTKKKYVVLAPTGIAAVNAGGQTMHSFFKLPFKPMLPQDPDVAEARRLKAFMKYSKAHIKLLRELDLIIIDEISMVRADTIDFVDRILRVYMGNMREPFGGKQLLLVGDVFQLEPVITGDIRDILNYAYPDGAFFFNAQVFRELHLVPIELQKVFRQTDDFFVRMLDRVRSGKPTADDINSLNLRVLPPTLIDDSDFTITIATRRDIVDSINMQRLEALNTPQHKFTGTITGNFPDSSLPTDKELVLKEGAQVVFVKNDPERRWVNGTIGIVTGFGEEDITVELADGTKHAVVPEVWNNVKYLYNEEKRQVDEDVLGSFTQYPLKLAWAITIHKSQGLTFDKVIIDLGSGAFSGGQTYVALSRCRSLPGITLRCPLTRSDVWVNQRVVDFSRTFNNPALINSALEKARADGCYHDAAVAFNNGDFGRAVDLFAEAMALRPMMHVEAARRLLKSKLRILPALQAKIEGLEAELEQKQRRFDELAREYVDMAETCREEGWEMGAAISNYDKAISLSPSMALAWLGKGLALGQMGEVDDAVECLLKAAKFDPESHRALLEAGSLLVGQGDLAAGMDYLLQALQRSDGKSPAVHLALADGYEKVGDADNADLHRRQAEKLRKKK